MNTLENIYDEYGVNTSNSFNTCPKKLNTNMNNTLHTPAPWKHDATWGLIKHGKSEICALHSGSLANARLIAAAPDLLSALEGLMKRAVRDAEHYDPDGPIWDFISDASDAICKAKRGV
jgi:hypothetical protein